MGLSYDGIGAWSATFFNGGIQEGELVKPEGYGTVKSCGDGEGFCGLALMAGASRDTCTVQLGGLVTTRYSGAEILPGWRKLAGDGKGGVKAGESGHEYQVVAANKTLQTVTFIL